MVLLMDMLLPAVFASTSLQTASNHHYDAIVLGTGLKESLISGLLASEGKRVLQLERSAVLGGAQASVDLQQLSDRTTGSEEPLRANRVGPPAEYSVDAAPKMFMAGNAQLQVLVKSGVWSHMEFKRIQRSLLYRKRPDGTADVHRVLANAEDVVKTRALKPMDKVCDTLWKR
jgi:RAB protein geranylgeranyltransferase component A